jgi:hypothetical protein
MTVGSGQWAVDIGQWAVYSAESNGSVRYLLKAYSPGGVAQQSQFLG